MPTNVPNFSSHGVHDDDTPTRGSIDPTAFAAHRGAYSQSESAHTGALLHPSVQASSALRRVCEHIEKHLAGALTLAELGRVAEYSPFHLARLFRAATGQSLHQYVLARRLARAKELMETSDLPLQQIALEVGFSDQSHFSNHYRRVFGHSPCKGRKIRHCQ